MIQELIRQAAANFGIKVEFTMVLLTFALLMARIVPVIIFSPFLGGEVIPAEVKLGIGLTLGFVIFPTLAPRMANIPVSAVPFLLLLLKEIFIGLSIAFLVSFVFDAAEIAGTFIDAMAGTNMAQVHVPQLQQQISLFSSLKIQLSVVLFLTLNGHHMVISALVDSLEAVPLDQYPAFSKGMWPFFDVMIHVFGMMVRISLSLAAPVFIALFLTDVALGMINRVAPQVQVFFVSMQIKPMVTVLMVMSVLHLILARMTTEFAGMITTLKEAIRLLT